MTDARGDYFEAIKALVLKYDLGSGHNPGGQYLTHPTLGEVQLSDYNDRKDYERARKWLEPLGEK